MSEKQDEIDALLEEVNALASEAVSEMGGAAPDAGGAVAVAPPPPAAKAAPAKPARSGGSTNIERVLHLEVPVIVRLAERFMALSEILNLTSGAIIEFEKRADAELDLMINNKCVAHGLAVKVGENFGLRVNQIGSLQDRIKALGS